MNSGRKILGKIIYTITNLISKFLDVAINIMGFFVDLLSRIARGFIALIGAGGCLLLFMLFGPFGIYLLLNPFVLLIITFLFILPLLGSQFISFLKYIKYMIEEYFYDLANSLIYDRPRAYTSFSEYVNNYKRQEEERKRKEEREKWERQQREWEEWFRQWYEYQNQQKTYDSYYDYTGQYNRSGGYQYTSPTNDFKKKYEESCDILGVPYDADKYQIKLAYRKKAKEYHPDLNKAPNATEMFQKINNAYEFLNDDNIKRYKNMN
ncbi:MAG: DnaJ domain-containing protein [Tissierellia bacterium]|nr:DnaJ domain-containing protein [Tissierellia bacterium]